jgi:hypothetical protein
MRRDHHTTSFSRNTLTTEERRILRQAQHDLARIVQTLDALPMLRQSKVRQLSNGALQLAEREVRAIREDGDAG